MFKVVTALLMAVAAVVVVAVGCGGDGDGDLTGSASRPSDERIITENIGLPLVVNSMTKERYVARANRLCRISWAEMREQFARARRKQDARTSDRDLFAEMSRDYFLPHIQFWFDDVSYLGTPEGDKLQLERMLQVMQDAVYAGQEMRITDAAQMSALFSDSNRLARQYGLDECVVQVESF